MKTIHNQTTAAAGSRFEYRPDRHYVLAERESLGWDGSTLEKLRNASLADGSDAYTVEADGERESDRRVVGSRRLILLSCPKEFAARRQAEYRDESRRNTFEVERLDEGIDDVQERDAVSWAEIA